MRSAFLRPFSSVGTKYFARALSWSARVRSPFSASRIDGARELSALSTAFTEAVTSFFSTFSVGFSFSGATAVEKTTPVGET